MPSKTKVKGKPKSKYSVKQQRINELNSKRKSAVELLE